MNDSALSGTPWRVLVLDRSSDDPKWIIATMSVPSDVQAAEMEPGGWRYASWPAVTQWVRGRTIDFHLLYSPPTRTEGALLMKTNESATRYPREGYGCPVYL